MSKRVWNLKYLAGNPAMFTTVRSDADNPRTRAVALVDAAKVAQNGWRVWVEHADTGVRILESEAEQPHAAAQEERSNQRESA